MKKSRMCKVAAALLCAAALAGAGLPTPLYVDASASAPITDTSANKSDDTLEEAKKQAKAEISDYGDIIKLKVDENAAKQIDQIVKRYNKIIGTAKQNKNTDGLSTNASVEDCIAEAKAAIDSAAGIDGQNSADTPDHTQPSSTSDFVMVGGNWVTPTATYGQLVDIVLPVVNMGTVNLANVTVTPVISNSVSEWPFVIETSGYTQTIPDLPGKGNGQSDMDRRRELTWTLRTRDDAMSGYYKLQFNVLYYVGTEAENVTLTTYVLVNGAVGSGNIENEGGGTSTPRVIVTGFMTNPAKVHAGDTFTLTLHLQNTSKRTAVSNMLVNFTAPSEGTDLDSTYAAFLPTSGSNSMYVSSIAKGATQDLSIELTAKSDLAQKPYQIDLNMEYEDESYTSYTSNADVSIPVYQDARFELSKPEILPEQIAVGNEANVMFSIYNIGKTTLYNVHVSFEGESISGGETFLGKVEAGGTGSVDSMVTGEKASTENDPVYVVITYEDESGNQSEYKQEIALTVQGEAQLGDEMDFYGGNEIEFEDDMEGGSGALRIVLIVAVCLIVFVVIGVILFNLISKKKAEKEKQNLLSDLEDDPEEGDEDEIS